MPTLILVRHGRSTANTEGLLAGWTPGVALDERGAAQAAALPGRLAELPLAEIVTSPLQRCQETLRPLLESRPDLSPHTDERIGECHYGDWSGRKLAELKDEPLMEVVQAHPSAAARVERDHGADAVYLMCSHGDVIKSLVADALGLHLDLFQRISVEPCSITAIRYTRLRPFLVRLGDTGDFTSLAPREQPPGGEAEVGGGAGAP